jgi:hypothetical protein
MPLTGNLVELFETFLKEIYFKLETAAGTHNLRAYHDLA